MEKDVTCPKCATRFKLFVVGRSDVKEVPTKITCPKPDCGQTFEVKWPPDLGWQVRYS